MEPKVELKFDPENPNYDYITTTDQANEALEILEKEKILGVDIESTDLDPYLMTLLTIQVGTPEKSYVFDARKLDLKNFQRFKELLENPKIIKLAHNAKFDYKGIKVQTGIELTNLYDTMLTEYILNAGVGRRYYSLKGLAAQYMGLDLKKDTVQTFARMTKNARLNEEQLRYAALDTFVMFPIFEQQIVKLKKENLVGVAKLEFATTRAVGDMELTGIFIDVPRWKKILADLSVKRDQFAQEFQDIVRPYYRVTSFDLFGNMADCININSQVQLMDLFNNRLEMNIPSTGDAILSAIDHPVAKGLRNYRRYEKLISAFGERLLNKVHPQTGRLHPEFNQLGTATGRFSCNNPNLQQIPTNTPEAPFRECFNPKSGYKLVTADYSSFEMRILADLSGDKKMKHALNEGLDIHSYTASLMFKLPYSEDFKNKHPELRQIGKTIGFGLMYGMGPVGLVSTLEMQTGNMITREEAQEYMDKFFASYPSVKNFLDKQADMAVKRGYSITPAGRKRWYNRPERTDPDYRKKMSKIQREAKNHPIQGTNADAIKYALVYIKDRIKKDGIDGNLTLTVHDEIVCEVRDDQAEDWAQVQSGEMVRAGEKYVKEVEVVSEPFVGDVWEH
ncbi:DNA polymerase [bacterium]|nr:DNA polymerase [bacterium]